MKALNDSLLKIDAALGEILQRDLKQPVPFVRHVREIAASELMLLSSRDDPELLLSPQAPSRKRKFQAIAREMETLTNQSDAEGKQQLSKLRARHGTLATRIAALLSQSSATQLSVDSDEQVNALQAEVAELNDTLHALRQKATERKEPPASPAHNAKARVALHDRLCEEERALNDSIIAKRAHLEAAQEQLQQSVETLQTLRGSEMDDSASNKRHKPEVEPAADAKDADDDDGDHDDDDEMEGPPDVAALLHDIRAYQAQLDDRRARDPQVAQLDAQLQASERSAQDTRARGQHVAADLNLLKAILRKVIAHSAAVSKLPVCVALNVLWDNGGKTMSQDALKQIMAAQLGGFSDADMRKVLWDLVGSSLLKIDRSDPKCPSVLPFFDVQP